MRTLWPDGHITEAADATEWIERIHKIEWNLDLTEEEFRVELARRAHVWSGEIVRPSLPDREFVEELAKSGLFQIL
jgi:hypothetical protein